MADITEAPPANPATAVPANRDATRGFFFALSACLLWGIQPLFMKALVHIPADAHLEQDPASRAEPRAEHSACAPPVAGRRPGLAMGGFRRRPVDPPQRLDALKGR